MFDIKYHDPFETIKRITKGWSADKKYYIETVAKENLLLRLADISLYERKYNEFAIMKQLARFNFPMSQPLDFGKCDNGTRVYSLLTWCDGEDAEIILPRMSEREQYNLGVKSGEILKEIHTIPAPDEQEQWEPRFNRKIDDKIKKYNECSMKIAGGDKIIRYIEAHRHLLEGRAQCFQHGDYHVGNMVISSEGKLSIIDFNRYDYGDPWEEFHRIVWSASISPHFATGQLNGYFNGKPPELFFKFLALYIGSNLLSVIPWAIPYGEAQINIMKNQANDVLTWFDGMRNTTPTWYLTDY